MFVVSESVEDSILSSSSSITTAIYIDRFISHLNCLSLLSLSLISYLIYISSGWQDDWGCERAATEVDAIVVETDQLRAAITPQWGGKVWSLYHKKYKRQLFFNNPAHQPNNIGYRKSWTSGGCEWNWSPGESIFSLSPSLSYFLTH